MSNLNSRNIITFFDNFSIKSKLIFGVMFISICSIIFANFLLTSSVHSELENVIFEKSSLQLDNYSSEIKESILISKDIVHTTISSNSLSEFLSLHHQTFYTPDYKIMKQSLSEEFVKIIENHPSLFQIRLIDSQGYEVIRIEKYSTDVVIIPENSLNFKGDRQYFSETMSLNHGELYISDIDLNVENGKIQLPYTPTLRLASPISDPDGQNLGIFIINLNMNTQLYNSDFDFGTFILTNSDGYFLVHPDSDKLFGNILEHEQNYFSEQPELEQNISVMDSKIHHDPDEKEFRNWIKVFYDDTNHEKFWLLVNVVPEEILYQPFEKTNFMLVFSILISVSFVIIATIILSRSFMSPIKKIIFQINQITKGNYDAKLNMSRKDEFGKIGNSFDSMLDKLVTSKNIQERYDKKLNEIIRDLENYKQALDASSIVTIADTSGTIVEVNDEFCKVSKYNRDELLGVNYRILKSGHHPKSFYQNLWETITNGDIWYGNIKNKAKDGTFYWEKKTIIPKLGPHGKLERYISVSTNITIQKEFEEQLLQTVNELNKTEVLKNEFASMVTHELKTPLTPIRGYCEMLSEGILGKLTAEQIECIKTIDSNAFQLEQLIGDILDAQKLDMNKMNFRKEHIDIKDIFDDIKNTFQPLFNQKNITLSIPNYENQIIYTDKNRLKQVFSNLIRNSIDFVSEQNGIIEVGMESQNDKLVFYVKDNGKGIPENKQSRIFKRFYQADTSPTRKHGGTGLGLAVCKGIVENLGGEIWFDSKPGIGTTFYFSIIKNTPHVEI